jgi:hypothetical protein
MGALQKILIVDDGTRRGGRTLSAELAGLGYASVTTTLEATDEILPLLGDLAAIVIDMPRADGALHAEFAALVARLRDGRLGATAPVIEIDSSRGGAPIDLGGWVGRRTVNAPIC